MGSKVVIITSPSDYVSKTQHQCILNLILINTLSHGFLKLQS